MSNNSTDKIWLSSPHMGGEERRFVAEAFDSNWVAPLGPNVNGFEKDLASYTGAKHASVLTSGTAAIHLALVMLGVEAGDVVMCQSFTFAATANPIMYQGAKPVFIDSEPVTWNMCPDALRAALSFRSGEGVSGRGGDGERVRSMPKAIIVVHLYGMPARMDEIRAVAAEYGVPIIEDAAEALGSHINGKMCGTFGKMGVLSFNGNKIITTSGGGAMVSDDEALIARSRYLATQARQPAAHYEHTDIGYNYRMSNITAGIGRGQMLVLDEWISRRRAMHDWYVDVLGGKFLDEEDFGVNEGWREGVRERSTVRGRFGEGEIGSRSGFYFLREPDGYFSNRWLTTVLVNPAETGGLTREDIRLKLEEANIEARPLWKPMHLQPVFKDSRFYGSGLSEFLFEHGLCLPSGSNLTEHERNRIAEAFAEMGVGDF